MGGGRGFRRSWRSKGERRASVLAVEAYAPCEPADYYADLGSRPPISARTPPPMVEMVGPTTGQ